MCTLFVSDGRRWWGGIWVGQGEEPYLTALLVHSLFSDEEEEKEEGHRRVPLNFRSPFRDDSRL